MGPRNAVTNAVTNTLVTRMSQTPVTAPRPNPTRPVLYMAHLLLLPTDIRDASEQQTIGEGMTPEPEPDDPELFPDPRTTTDVPF
jgi:hypothetical protein